MEKANTTHVKRIRKLEMDLKAYCTVRDISEIPGGFLVMYDAEFGHNIIFVRDMQKKKTGEKDLHMYNEVKWPYTGFAIGNMFGWIPISPEEIVKKLQKHGYSLGDFEREFEEYTHGLVTQGLSRL